MDIPPDKHRTSWIDATFPVAFILLIAIGMFLVFQSSENQASALPSDEERATSTKIDTIDSNYPGIKISTETSNDPSSPYAVQYPQSVHSSFNEDVSTYIEEVKQDYIQSIREYKEAGGKEHGELNVSFETLLHHSGNYSFVLVTNHFSGGASGTTEIRSFHLNPVTGKSIKISDVFQSDAIKLENLTSLVREAISKEPTLDNFLFTEEINTNTKPLWRNYSNFALTNKDLILYFAENLIAEKATGAPIIAIPLDKIDNSIANEFKTENEIAIEIKNEPKEIIQTESIPKKPVDNSPAPADPDTKKVALTFDDGPHPKVTRQILEILKKYDAKATFFMLGSRVEYYPDIANEVKEAGHELGNHSWNHPDLTNVSVEKVRNEINSTSEIIEQATNQKATVFRPPYGAVNETVSAQTDLPVILWDVDTLDWKHRDANRLLPIVKASVRDKSNILMHDIHQSTADSLDGILAYLKREGYTFVTVSELN